MADGNGGDAGGDLLHDALRADRERALPVLFAPADARPALCALVLLNQELGKVPEAVSQTMPGLIRFQWWRDALAAARTGGGPNHPVARALGAASTLPLDQLEALIDAREAELEGLAPEDMGALEAYLASTAGRLQALMCRVLAPADRTFDAAATVAGTAYGLIGVVRAVGHHARHSRVLLPRDLLDRAEVTPEMVIRRQNEERLVGVRAALAARATALVVATARHRPPRDLMPAFLLSVHTRRHAGRAKDGGEGAPAASPLVPLSMLWRYWRRRP